MTAKEHNKLVGIFLIAHGALTSLMMLIAVLIYGGMGAFMLANARRDEEQMVGAIFIGMVLFVVFISTLLVIPQFVGGWKLLKEKAGARNWGIAGSIIALLSFPLGTAAGVYGLWFLFGEEGRQLHLGGGARQNAFNPPPPNNWQ